MNSVDKLEDILEGFSLDSKGGILPRSDRQGSFKSTLISSQQKRRDDLIKDQSENRAKRIKELRERLKSKKESEDVDVNIQRKEESMEDAQDMEIEKTRSVDKKESYLIRKYRDILMLPELLLDIPIDFVEKWSAVPYPNGTRCIIVSGNGKTESRLQSGVKLMEPFESLIPGGSSYSITNKTSILDCIYVEEEQTFYVLDIIMWKGLDFIDCECDCRFFLRNSKLEEIDGIDKIKKGNDYAFKVLRFYECSKEGLTMAKIDNPNLEGIMFYHNQAIYISERNPLMCGLSKDKIDELIQSL